MPFASKPLEARNGRQEAVLQLAITYRLDTVVLELREDGFVPDVRGMALGQTLYIEIRVTHEVDARKRERLERRGVSTLEIDLSRLDPRASMPTHQPSPPVSSVIHLATAQCC
jgi:hypothetical protein